MAFQLTPTRFGKDPWHSRVVVSRQHQRQQQYAQAAAGATTRNAHPTTCSMNSTATSSPHMWSVRPSRWLASTLVKQLFLAHRRTPSFDNSSSARAAARCFVIKFATFSVRSTLSCSRSCVHKCPISKCLSLPVPCPRKILRQALLSLHTLL